MDTVWREVSAATRKAGLIPARIYGVTWSCSFIVRVGKSLYGAFPNVQCKTKAAFGYYFRKAEFLNTRHLKIAAQGNTRCCQLLPDQLIQLFFSHQYDGDGRYFREHLLFLPDADG